MIKRVLLVLTVIFCQATSAGAAEDVIPKDPVNRWPVAGAEWQKEYISWHLNRVNRTLGGDVRHRYFTKESEPVYAIYLQGCLDGAARIAEKSEKKPQKIAKVISRCSIHFRKVYLSPK